MRLHHAVFGSHHAPLAPTVLDLGCGVGGQTLHVATLLTNALITAIDSHA
ncbi:MAG TPA: class I SAM-dependent methyltransferase [Polyangiaceae bacterium]|nr:class I SAM-dependent methyltransferase [Polyangiaceae bacterium]